MTIEKKLLGTNPSGGSIDVADVFSTYLYTGANGSQTNVNGIDLTGEGGMVWTKIRSHTSSHDIFDTDRGAGRSIDSASTTAEYGDGRLSAFTSSGFTGYAISGYDYASWTFRKAKKFFDVVTYTGNGVAGREIAHGLAGPVGMLVVKCTNAVDSWSVYHKNIGNTKYLNLNATDAEGTTSSRWNNTSPTDSVFTTGGDGSVNGNNNTYVAYLFADNSAEDADEQMIKCGSYTGNGSSGFEVNLGWEPQFVLQKSATTGNSWTIVDSMRGMLGQDSRSLMPNSTAAEQTVGQYNPAAIQPTATGFKLMTDDDGGGNGSGVTYVYMAIRAPMMKEPESATEVFAASTRTGNSPPPSYVSGFPIDMFFTRGLSGTSNTQILTRMTGTKYLRTNTADAEGNASYYTLDRNDGFYDNATVSTAFLAWMFRRAKGFMDCVAYQGTGSARTQAHSLGVVPELILVKNRGAIRKWAVYSAPTTATDYLILNEANASYANGSHWSDTEPTDSLFSLGTYVDVNASANTYVAYLFASLDGVSKCGSYVGNGSSQTLNCGFAAGARFILIKRTDATGDWYFWDTTRGIVAGNDPHLSLNTTAAQVTSDDSIDPANSGFIVNQVSATNINVSSGTYIFYAIA